MARGKVTIFGGTGFLGRCVVRHLLESDRSIRVASRHPERATAVFADVQLGVESIYADVNDDRSVAAAVAAVEGAVNAVSLYVENERHTFHSVHVTAAARVARLARDAGVEQLIHVSGIGSDAESASPYIRSRGEGERVVREAFPTATLIRPSVMFGQGDAFLTPVAGMLRRMPIFPLFGYGQTQLQPVHVEDVAEAIARAMQSTPSRMCYELGGPRIYAYRSLLETIARHLGGTPRLVAVPFSLWRALALAAEMLPDPPITRNQVALMQEDNVASPDGPGFAELQISPASLEEILPAILDQLHHMSHNAGSFAEAKLQSALAHLRLISLTARIGVTSRGTQRPSKTKLVAIRVGQMKESLAPFGIPRGGVRLAPRRDDVSVERINVRIIEDHSSPPSPAPLARLGG